LTLLRCRIDSSSTLITATTVVQALITTTTDPTDCSVCFMLLIYWSSLACLVLVLFFQKIHFVVRNYIFDKHGRSFFEPEIFPWQKKSCSHAEWDERTCRDRFFEWEWCTTPKSPFVWFALGDKTRRAI